MSYGMNMAGASGKPRYRAHLVNLDGTDTYLERVNSALSGAVNSKLCIFSIFIEPSNAPSGPVILDLGDGSGHDYHGLRVDIGGDTAGKLTLKGTNSAGSQILDAVGSTTLVNGSPYSILAAVDMSNPANRGVVINGTPETMAWNTYANDSLAFSSRGNSPRLGARSDSPDHLYGGNWAHLWLAIASYLDPVASYGLFFDRNNRPLYKGANGSLKTGIAPALFLAGNAAAAGKNSGTGGDFNKVGTPTDAGRV